MRIMTMRTPLALAAAALLTLGTALPPAGYAQNNPSSESIIQSLKPTGGSTTRGIHPVGPEAGPGPISGGGTAVVRPVPPHPRAGMRPAAPPVVAGGNEAPSVNLTVQFRTGSADLSPSATHTLDELGRALSSPTLAGYHFRIEGHTDTVGSPEKNKMLSQERAEKVVEYLATKYGVDKSRLEAVGMGEEGLLVPTPAGTAEPRNRRVTVVNVGA
jgi:outer membrane protein OmpA-like peptidoglycan-associated protein